MDGKLNSGKKLTTFQKMSYGFSGIGGNFCWSFVASFVLLYFTNVVGADAAVVGTLMLIARIFDGISDILFGNVIDRTRSKLGKARFWYLISTLPTAVCVYLVFNVPAGFTENTKYIYIFIVYTLMGAVFYTILNIAAYALVPLVTKDVDERTQMHSYMQFMALIAVIIMTSVTSDLVEYFGGGQAGWRAVSLIYAIICFVTLMIPFFTLHEMPEEEYYEGNKQAQEEKRGLLATVVLLAKNKYAVLGMVYYIFASLASGVFQGLGIYYVTYVLGNASLLGILTMAGMLPTALLVTLVPKLFKKTGVRDGSLGGFVIVLLGAILAYVGGGLGSFAVILLGLTIRSAGYAPMSAGLNVLLAEADDYSFMKYGEHISGSIYSVTSMGIKVGTGLGTSLCGFLLTFSKYDAALAVQSAFTQTVIKNAYFIPYILYGVIGIVVLILFDVEKQNKKLREERSLGNGV